MKNTELLIMAAGMGSRFGGLKQIEPIGPNGEIILDFSVCDAVKAGFNKVVIVIEKEIEKDFREACGKRIEKMVDVEYAFQELDKLPDGYSLPAGRVKPWGLDLGLFPYLEKEFMTFLDGRISELKSEFFLPSAVSKRIEDEKKTVSVLETKERWYGVTYREDMPSVRAAMEQFIREGLYW